MEGREANMTSWCKVAADLDCHPKIRKAGRDGREVFLFILRRNSLGNYEGRLPIVMVDPDYLADQLMMSADTARNGIVTACNAGLLRVTERHVVISGWEFEWSKSSMTNAERQARHREKLRADVELPANSNGQSREVTSVTEDKNRLDKKRERDASPPAPRAHTLPDDWKPTDCEANRKEESKARSRGVDLDAELESMRDWSKGAGSKGKKSDWDATWRNWTRRANVDRRQQSLNTELRVSKEL